MDGEFPRRLGNYTLLGRLGRGGMGDVYAARVEGFRGIQKLCVIKTLKEEYAQDKGYVARFLDEARLVMQLTHRNICNVFDVGEVDNEYFLAMDLVRGRDLRTLWARALDENKPLEPALGLYMGIEVLDGLDYAHRATDVRGRALNIVHRDVSPQNVMISFEGDIQVIDFGLAFHTQKSERTESNIVQGKTAYMPPEQVRGDPADQRADVFAAAVIIYELLADERFYENVPAHQLVAIAANGKHKPTNWALIDDDIQQVLEHALDPVKEHRTPSAGRFVTALRECAARRGMRCDAATVRGRMRELFGNEPNPWEVDDEHTPVDPLKAKSERSRSVAVRVSDGVKPLGDASAMARPATSTSGRSQPPPPPLLGREPEKRHDATTMLPDMMLPNAPPLRDPPARAQKRVDATTMLPDALVQEELLPDRGARRGDAEMSVSFIAPASMRAQLENSKETPAGRAPDQTKLLADIEAADKKQPAKSGEKKGAKKNEDGTDDKIDPKTLKDRHASSAHTQSIATRAALGGAAILLLFVLFIFVAPWRKQSSGPKKEMLPLKATLEDKRAFVDQWCPKMPCLQKLDGKEAEPGYAQGVDQCYRQCYGQ